MSKVGYGSIFPVQGLVAPGLYVGSREKRKNVPGLVRIFAAVGTGETGQKPTLAKFISRDERSVLPAVASGLNLRNLRT